MFPAGHLPSTAWCSFTLCPVHLNWLPQNASRKTLDSSRIIWKLTFSKTRMTSRRASSPLSSSSSSNWFWSPHSSPYSASHEPVITRLMPRLSLHKRRRVRSTTTSIGNKFGFKKNILSRPAGQSWIAPIFFFFFPKCTFSFVSFRDSKKIFVQISKLKFHFLPLSNFSPRRKFLFPGQNFISNFVFLFFPLFLPLKFSPLSGKSRRAPTFMRLQSPIPGISPKIFQLKSFMFSRSCPLLLFCVKNGFKFIHSQDFRSHNFPF